MNETLTIASLGETTLIGALYDARDQIFINDVRLISINYQMAILIINYAKKTHILKNLS